MLPWLQENKASTYPFPCSSSLYPMFSGGHTTGGGHHSHHWPQRLPKGVGGYSSNLNLSLEAYHCLLREIEFGPDYKPWLIWQKIRAVCLWWLQSETRTKEQIMEYIIIEYYTALLPFKPNNLVLCNKPATLEDATTLMEVYASTEARQYLIPKGWKKKAEGRGGPQGQGTGGLSGRPAEKQRSLQGAPEADKEMGKKAAPAPLPSCGWKNVVLHPTASRVTNLGTSKGNAYTWTVPGWSHCGVHR